MEAATGWPTTRVTLLVKIRDACDDRAWRDFVDIYAPVVYGYCHNRGLQEADAQNISQEVFGRVSRAIQGFEYDAQRGRFRSWLGLITHQQMLRYRHQQVRANRTHAAAAQNEELDAFSGEAEGAWSEAFNAHIYSRAMENIRGEFATDAWQAFQRVWNGHDRPADVAREMNAEPQWVYQVKHRIMQRLREEIQRLSDDAPTFHRT